MNVKDLWEKIKTWEEKATPKEKYLIVFISVLIPVFLFYQFYYTQAKEKINKIEEEIRQLDLKIRKYKNIVKKKELLEAQMRQRKEFLKRVKTILPSESEIPDILRKISDLAKDNDLEVIIFQPGREIPKNYYDIIPLKMKLKGRFDNIVNFLNSIENLERLIVLNDIKFQIKNDQLIALTTFYTFKYTGKPLNQNKNRKKGGGRR